MDEYNKTIKKQELKIQNQYEMQLKYDNENSEHFNKVNQLMMDYKK
jgi:hypothetical protein